MRPVIRGAAIGRVCGIASARLLLLTVLLAAVLPAAEIADLAKERQVKLYYSEATLPKTVKELIDDARPVADYAAAYAATRDEITKFNLVIIIDKKLRRPKVAEADRKAGLALLVTATKEGNPWVQTEAVFALGNAKGKEANAEILHLLKSESDLAFFHAVLAYAQANQVIPELDEDQRDRFLRMQAFMDLGPERQNQLADIEMERYLKRKTF